MSYWQVGNSSEQNGMFKMNWVKEKERLIIFKAKHNLPLTLNTTDIIPMISKAWDASFTVPEFVIKAVANRGWNPLNFALLTNKEILGTKRAKLRQEQQVTNIGNQMEVATNLSTDSPNLPTATVKCKDDSNLIIEINVGKGTAKKCVSALVEIVLCNGSVENQGEELARGEQNQKDLLDLSKWTSGHLVKQRQHCLTMVKILHAAQ